jgi:hypothetical protein
MVAREFERSLLTWLGVVLLFGVLRMRRVLSKKQEKRDIELRRSSRCGRKSGNRDNGLISRGLGHGRVF